MERMRYYDEELKELNNLPRQQQEMALEIINDFLKKMGDCFSISELEKIFKHTDDNLRRKLNSPPIHRAIAVLTNVTTIHSLSIRALMN